MSVTVGIKSNGKSYFLYLFSIVVRTYLFVACGRVWFAGCALLVALGNAVRVSGDCLGFYVLSQ